MAASPKPSRDDGELCATCPARQGRDGLTGLLDRSAFLARLDRSLAPDGEAVGLLLIDLDRFKAVNDTLGHPAGDALLRAAAGRLRGALRGADVAARLGGDEFAVLLSAPVPPETAISVGDRLVALLSRPYMIAGQIAIVGTSIGAALAPADAADARSLLICADLALHQAKREGRGRARRYAADMQSRAEGRRKMEQDLRAALPLGQFLLYYQPQVEARSGRLTGFEALLRWRHPERGLVAPGAFVPLAEEIGLITPIGEWVLRDACAEAARWPDDLRVAVNVAAPQFESGRLVPSVVAALGDAGLPGARLELEITESALLGAQDGSTIAQLEALQALGVQLSLDDFGTGYSSLTQLRSFPFDRVKIDRAFADDAPVVRAIAALGASLGMRTTAEGVETEAQMARIRADGCTDIQGYLIGRPVPAEQLRGVIGSLTKIPEHAA